MFRDLSDTGLNPSLWGTVQRQLDGSSWFILLASPGSAASKWVTQEVDHWCATKGVDTILLVLTDGELAWDRAAGRFAPTATALAPSVAARFTSEPLHLDLRWARDVDPPPTLRDPRFTTEMARLASPIRGLAPADLESEDVRLHRTARRLARGAVAALVTLAIVATIAAVLAVRNANEAERRARQAIARQLGLAALDMPASDLDQALLLSSAASALDPDAGSDRFLASRTLLGRHSRLVALLHTPSELGRPSVRGVAISPAGDAVAATVWPSGGAPVVVRWDGPAGSEPTSAPLPTRSGPAIALRDDGRTVTRSSDTLAVATDGTRALVAHDGGTRLIDPVAGGVLAEWPGTGALAMITGDRAAFVADTVLHLVDTVDGGLVGSVELDAEPVAVAVRDDTVVTAAERGELSWWQPDRGALASPSRPVTVDAIGRPTQLTVADGGRRVLVVGDRATVMVDGTIGTVLATDAATGTVAADATGRFAAVGGNQLTVWSLVFGRPAIAVEEQVNAMRWSGCDDGPCRLATVGESLDVWEPITGRRTQLADQTNAQTVDITADGGTVVSGGWGSSVAVWTLGIPIDDTSREELTPPGPPAAVDQVSGAVARLVGDTTVEVATGGDTTRVTTPAATTIALLDGATRLLTSSGSELHLFDAADGAPIPLAPQCSGDLWAVSPLGRRLVAHRLGDGRTVVCDTADGTVIAGAMMIGDDGDELPGVLPAPGAPAVATVSGDAPVTAVAVDDHSGVALGRTAAGHVEFHVVEGRSFRPNAEAVDTRFGGERVAIGSLAISHGRIAAAILPRSERSGSARVLVWDAAERGTPVQFSSDQRDLAAVALIGDAAELVAAAGRGGTGDAVVVQVWEAESRRRLGRGLGGLVDDVAALGGDAASVVGTDTGGRTFRWLLDQDPRREVCEIVGRALTPDEWSTVAGGVLERYDHDPVCPGR